MRLPVMRLFAPRQRAYIYVFGRRHYLGPWGSRAADDAYRAKVRSLLGVTHTGPVLAIAPHAAEIEVVTVAHLAMAYRAHARSYYAKAGRPTPTAAAVSRVLDLLSLTGRDHVRVDDADAEWLRVTREKLAARLGRGATRGTLNAYVGYIVRMFRFAGEHGLAADDQWLRLRAVGPVKRGRPPAPGLRPMREGVERRPVPPSFLRAARPHLSRTIRIMLDVQLLTGMRPNELCHLRPCDLSPTKVPGVKIYTVPAAADKTDYQDEVPGRRVWIGPRALRLLSIAESLRRSLSTAPPSPFTYCFTPAVALAERAARMADRRATPVYQTPDDKRAARRLRGVPPAMLGEKYTPDAYRRAVERACAAAMAAQSAIEKSGAEISDLVRAGRFTPYQLRHNCATEIANREQIQVAQVMLGHRDIKTTSGYVRPWEKHAVAAALKYG